MTYGRRGYAWHTHCVGIREVEVALTILKLTRTERRAGRRTDWRHAQGSIGMHAHPKITKTISEN